MTRAESAVENKRHGMNCAQAVASVFTDLVDTDKETLLAMTQALGVGIGATLDGTCGAVTGGSMIIGLAERTSKSAAMKKAGNLVREFKQKNQTVVCKELKGIESGVVIRECNDCVKDAVEILEKLLDIEADKNE